MPTISIWYKPQGGRAEVVDHASTPAQAAYLEGEYQLAFGCSPGQRRHGKDKVWAGRRDQEPDTTTKAEQVQGALNALIRLQRE